MSTEQVSVNVTCDKQQEDTPYRGNLAGFIVLSLMGLLFLLVGVLTAYYMFSTGGVWQKDKTNAFFSTIFSSLHEKWGDEKKPQAANVYFFTGILCSFAAVIYLVCGMVFKPLFWHPQNYAMNVPLWGALAMTAYTWYFDPQFGNGIGWVWTVLLVLALGWETLLVLVHFVDAKHAYVLPWIKSEAIPNMVI